MILLLAEVFPPKRGGSGRWLWELYRRLPQGSVYTVADTAPGADIFDMTHDLPISRIPLRFPNWGVFNRGSWWSYIGAMRALHRVVRRERPAVIHCGKCLPEGLLALALQTLGGPPYWCYVHGEELTLTKLSSELRWLTRRVLRRASRIIANSQHTRDLLIRHWGQTAERVHIMHPGVDTQTFVPAPPDPITRDRLGWGDRPVVLTVGALQRRKGQDTMIAALPRLLRQYPDLLYSIAGEGWERNYLEHLVTKLGLHDSVEFRGMPEDRELIECYQQCDVFALPNRQVGWDFEGFGIVLLEAQACGKPVVTGTSGGTTETLHANETGFVVDCTSPDDLAKVVADSLADPGQLTRMGSRARSWAVERFDWSSLLLQAKEMFGSTLEPTMRRRMRSDPQ